MRKHTHTDKNISASNVYPGRSPLYLCALSLPLHHLTCQSRSPLTPPGLKLVSAYCTKHLLDNN
jgi:hypothetical protein